MNSINQPKNKKTLSIFNKINGILVIVHLIISGYILSQYSVPQCISVFKSPLIFAIVVHCLILINIVCLYCDSYGYNQRSI